MKLKKSKGWIERDGEKWKLKKLWVQKAEVDKSGNDELEYSENRNCWYLKVETQWNHLRLLKSKDDET